MADVSTLFDTRWLSRNMVGDARPYIKVLVRRGHYRRDYEYWAGGDVNAVLQNGVLGPAGTWVATWVPDSAYVEIPNVYRVQLQQDLGNQNGITAITMDVENVVYVEKTGPTGLVYNLLERGYLSPLRGYVTPSRQVAPVDSPNEWARVLERNAQLLIYAGYGPDTAVPVFTGLIDKDTLAGNPARITVTGRDFGKALTDQWAFGDVKDKKIPDPIVFADRRSNDQTFVVGGAATASSHDPGYPAHNVTDSSLATAWRSAGVDTSNWTEWIDIHLPEGRYEDFFLAPQFSNLECFVSINATQRSLNRKPTFNGVPQQPGWMNVTTSSSGAAVPGQNGGVPYIRHMAAIDRRPRQYSLLGSFVVGDNSVLRISFRNLQRSFRDGRHHAGARTLKAIRRQRDKTAHQQQWILVDDLSDIVKVVLRWAGFKEWQVQQTGVRMKKNDTMVFNRKNKLVDIIKKVQDLTGFVFFMGDPTFDSALQTKAGDGSYDPGQQSHSIGVPVFRQSSAMIQNPGAMRGVRDEDLLTSITATIDDEPLGWPIRVRGQIGKRNQGARKLGIPTHDPTDTALRFAAFYMPPWTDRLAGLMKHVIHYDNLLTSDAQCYMAALLIAFQEALAAGTADVECPANPGVQVEDQFAIVDSATGLSTRLYVTNRTQVFQTGGGETGGVTGTQTAGTGGVSLSRAMSWSMTLQGALLDTPDVQDVLRDIATFTSDSAGTEDVPTIITGRPQVISSFAQPTSVGPNKVVYPTDAIGSWPQEPG